MNYKNMKNVTEIIKYIGCDDAEMRLTKQLYMV